MNHQQTHSDQQLRLHFKQWSNKGYAAFCSMGKVVHIGNLAISLAQWMGNIVEFIEEITHICLDNETDECAEELLEQELLQVIPVVNSTVVEGEKSVFNQFKNINCR